MDADDDFEPFNEIAAAMAVLTHEPAQAAVDQVKRAATAKACCALWGGVLSETDDDGGRPLYVVTRWSLTRSFHSLDEVMAFLRRVGAPGA